MQRYWNAYLTNNERKRQVDIRLFVDKRMMWIRFSAIIPFSFEW